MTAAGQQLTFADLQLRVMAGGLPEGLPLVMRWRKLLRRVSPPPASKVSLVAFRSVGTVLADYADRNGRSCFPDVDTIAADAGVCRRTALYALAALEERRLIVRRRRRRASTDYELCVPRPVDNPVHKVVDNDS